MLDAAPDGSIVEFRENKRTTEQNSRLWAMLGDVSSQLTWHGARLSSEDWKLVFLASLAEETRIVPNLSGNGFVNLGRSSSRLTKSEMGLLMDLIDAFGAQHGVVFHDRELEPA